MNLVYKRVIDDVPMKVNLHIGRFIDSLLPGLQNAFEIGKLMECMAESDETANGRKALESRKERLQQASKVLSEL
jgi:hypothetical protein